MTLLFKGNYINFPVSRVTIKSVPKRIILVNKKDFRSKAIRAEYVGSGMEQVFT